MSFTSVVLPPPEGPTIATDSPGVTQNEQLRRTKGSMSEYRNESPRTSSEASMASSGSELDSSSGGVSTMSARRSP